ncbi:MAG: glycoside hydrolase family 2 TIM barrel-domain containing protein [Terriglobia bacterium]
MKRLSRRKLLKSAVAVGTGAALPQPAQLTAAEKPSIPHPQLATLVVPLDGQWLFTLVPESGGAELEGSPPTLDSGPWAKIVVPHTWQTSEESADFHGTALYRTYFQAPAQWAGKTVRIEFEAVTHSATVWVNETQVGEHLLKGYTAFSFDVTDAIKFGVMNAVTVRVNNRFNTRMLPRETSFDWTPDGGIIRPVSLLVSPPVYIERIEVDAVPRLDDPKSELAKGNAQTDLDLRAVVRNAGKERPQARVRFSVSDYDVRYAGFPEKETPLRDLAPNTGTTLAAPTSIKEMKLWHFDRPRLYRVTAELECDGRIVHTSSETFGVRKFEARGSKFFLNGRRVRLMGVERMAGSHPDYGMAEPASWIEHDHNDLKELNCVFTRVHWPQDKRVLDYCDRHGILMQEEVPAWGPDTFKGTTDEPSPEIMENGLEQLREMIVRDRNHPCIVAWGLCNEVNGQNPPAQKFIRGMAAEARQLDPSRLLTYASNSLQHSPERDVAGELDFISWNEYYETWQGGKVESIRPNAEAIHQAFPEKPIVVSEYGYCECAPDRTGGDARRIAILKSHTNVYRRLDYIAGAIFFDYNDYRTHVGDKGTGAIKQRVHGVVDLLGNRKPSFAALRAESSPFSELRLVVTGRWITATMEPRGGLPSYRLEGYTMRCIIYGFGDLPVEETFVPLPTLDPGNGIIQEVSFEEKSPKRIRVDLLRPTGFSAITSWWSPPTRTRSRK